MSLAEEVLQLRTIVTERQLKGAEEGRHLGGLFRHDVGGQDYIRARGGGKEVL